MFESLIMQTAGEGVLYTAASIAGSIAVIAPIIAHYIGKINPKLKIVSQYADTFAEKTTEYTDDVHLLIDAIGKTSPETIAYLNEKGKGLSYWDTRLKIAAQQAQRFKGEIQAKDPELLASSVKDLPREGFDT